MKEYDGKAKGKKEGVEIGMNDMIENELRKKHKNFREPNWNRFNY